MTQFTSNDKLKDHKKDSRKTTISISLLQWTLRSYPEGYE